MKINHGRKYPNESKSSDKTEKKDDNNETIQSESESSKHS